MGELQHILKPKRMFVKRTMIPLACLAAALCTSAHAIVVFSNDFEDDNLTPEIGSWVISGATTESVITTAATDVTLGDKVSLFDQGGPLDMTISLTDDVSLGGGNTVTLSFDAAFRRTNGSSKTIYFDAVDSGGDIVARFVLGDAGGTYAAVPGARQRPGYATMSGGNVVLPAGTGTTPGNFWWGADTSTASFATTVDAHFTLTYGANGFDVSTTRQSGATYSTSSSLSTYDGGTFADIAEIKVSSLGGANYGVYLDNIEVEGTLVPEPSSIALLGLGGLALVLRRRK
ncbi:PEP-CTERM sorting domain-containing protein [Haloferula sp.]|uniref:PEP-CTERM sorting domain-containing protein n=1 Tax=Haloferula sp. TaxID=2497595 RepID=UPI00329B662E